MVTDVTERAIFKSADSGVAQIKASTAQAISPGKTLLSATVGSESVTASLTVGKESEKFGISFVKDIVPIFTRAGCAGANCHGSIRGKGGFKLSLFGYEPDIDFAAILESDNGRRVNLTDAKQSLILRKPTFQVPHGGGVRFQPDSLEYTAILDWIAGGARYDSAGSPRVVSLTVEPHERRLVGVGSRQQLIVTARYTDGSTEDVTGKVQFSSNDEAVASVDSAGIVRAGAPGETAIMVRTLGHAAAARVAVIKDPPMLHYPRFESRNFVDDLVFAKLKSANVLLFSSQ